MADSELDDFSLDDDSDNDIASTEASQGDTAKKQGLADVLPLMFKNYVLPILKETHERDNVSESSDDDITHVLDTSSDAKSDESDEQKHGGKDYSKIVDGVVSLFDLVRETKAEQGSRHSSNGNQPGPSGSRKGRRLNRGPIRSDEEAKQIVGKFADCGVKIFQGLGAYNNLGDDQMESVNNRFGLSSDMRNYQRLTVNFDKVLLRPESKPEKDITRLVKQITEMMFHEQYINNIISSDFLLRYANFCPILPSGSVSDGFSTPRWFANNDLWEIETDLMYILGTFPQEMQSYFVDDPVQKAYCFIQGGPILAGFIHTEVFQMAEEVLSVAKYVNSLQFKKLTLKFIRQYHLKKQGISGTSSTDTLFNFASKFPIIDKDRVANLKPSFSKSGHLASTVICTAISYNTFQASIDHVPCFKLDFWPTCLQHWLTRGGQWPKVEERQSIMAMGCHVVPKLSNQVLEEGFRYSFSLPEQKLMQLFSKGQRISYYLFKALFYKYIKQIGQKQDESGEIQSVFHSYLFKTTMFWVCEKYPPTDPLWMEENLFLSQEILLHQFEEYMQSGFLPHFFIPDYSLVQDIPIELMSAAANKVRNMRKNLPPYMPFNMKEMLESVKDFGIRFGLQYAMELAFQHSFFSPDCFKED